IDGFRSGYPQFSALTSAYDGFFVCRRFARLRARVLLAKQDRLSQLEHELDQVDQEESRPLFLGKMRGDLNTKRTELLGRIEDCLDNYVDSFLEKTQRALRMQSANPKDVESLKNWIDGTGSLSSAETSYLGHAHDLVSLASCDDKATRQIENWLGMKFVNYFPKFREVRHIQNSLHIGNNTSDDPNVFLYNGTLITTITKMLVVWSVVRLFLFPIITCILISSPSQRIGVAVASIVVFIVASASLAELRTTELIITGAT
ncbi:hypothetical protein GQ53DRAFT_637562, partial [Thozetella sp. PMI_491]